MRSAPAIRDGRAWPALRAARVVVAALAALATVATQGAAQALDAASSGVRSVSPSLPAHDSTTGASAASAAAAPLAVPRSRRAPAPLWAPLASALVPGLGQAAMRQDRFVAYLALEAFGWLQFANDLAEGRRRREEYRRLARDVARANFSDWRPVGDFDYYERMEHFVESGVYDVAPGGALEPETDTLTYNGSLWLLARQTFWDDPEVPPDPASAAYATAIDFYQRRAIRPEYRWSWRGAQLEQDLFRRTIARSNDAFRRSATDLGVVLANHVLSAVDASISLRVRRRGASRLGGEGFAIESSLPWPSALR